MAENAADLPEHRILAAIFLTDDITRVLHSCDDDDNEHVLLSNRAVGVMASLHNVVFASFVAQVKSVVFYDLSVSGS